ncbi:MAG TPA: flagellar filament capping protein FliD, partial [bacterium]|nr:flagellar filament capping protein FliD [bacterium]
MSLDEGTAITGLIPNVGLSGFSGHTFSPGAAVIRTVESSELNVRPATAPAVFGKAGIAGSSTATPPLDIFVSLATAGFAATVESSSVNAVDHTDGTFTINGKAITIPSTATTVQEVLGLINASGAGVIAGYDAANDRITLQGATPGNGGITLGASGDTSNFLRIAGLTEAAGGVTMAGNDPGKVDADATLSGAGLTIAPTSGTFTINGVTITVDTGSDTLATLIDKINSSAAGVEAAYDPNQDRLTLTQKLGANVTGSGISVGDPSDTSNILAALRLTDTPSATTQAGTSRQEAIFTVDGVTYTRPTNTITDVLPGVTLTLQAVSTDPVTIDIANDTDKALAGLRDFVVAYNKTMKLLNVKPLDDDEREKLKPLTDAEKAQLDFFAIEEYEKQRLELQQRDLLFNDTTVRRAVQQLRRQLLDPVVGAAADLDRLTSLGLGTGTPGAGPRDPQVQSGFLVKDSIDPDEILEALKNNPTLADLLKNRATDVQELFGKPLESQAKVSGSLSVVTGVTLSSRLTFAVGDGRSTGTVTLEAGNYTSSQVLNRIQDAL